jgi:hypothetical protein
MTWAKGQPVTFMYHGDVAYGAYLWTSKDGKHVAVQIHRIVRDGREISLPARPQRMVTATTVLALD